MLRNWHLVFLVHGDILNDDNPIDVQLEALEARFEVALYELWALVCSKPKM